jgi:aminocarboxymuconate-semialdehyde decarboxylase
MIARKRAPIAIDIHAHILLPEVYAITAAHSAFGRSVADPAQSEEARKKARERSDLVCARMADVTERIAAMDRMGVDVQVLSASLVHQCTYWAPPVESLRLERMLNEHVARLVAAHPSRFVGLGSVPLHAPDLAAREVARCVTELGLRGVTIATRVGDMEIGDRRLWPFWEKAEEHGALVYVHPAGNPSPRFQKYFLWNSIGQNFEEAMAIASLMYEGVLDAFPRLRICISHGGGYMPLCLGRITRNYLEKPSTRVNMTKSPAEYLRMLYYDTCVYETEELQHLIGRVGADRVILGSDYPVGEQRPIEFVEATPGLSDADKDKIIGLNAAKLFALDAS